MLTKPNPHQPPSRSLRKEYEEFVAQCVEEYKNQLSRQKLLELADEAVQQLCVEADGQLSFTEVVLAERVDELIMKGLNLPTFRKWKPRHARMRAAQRDPTHWALEPGCPLTDVAPRLEPEDLAVVVGKAALPAAFFLAAHDVSVLFIDNNLSVVDAAETRAAAEGLAYRFEALVLDFSGSWFPEFSATLVVLDPQVLADAPTGEAKFFNLLKKLTVPGGVHCILPARQASDGSRGVTTLPLHDYYADWTSDPTTMSRDSAWLVATKLASSA